MLSIGMVGCGLWGPNLARNFHTHPRSVIKTVCDLDRSKAEVLSRRLGGVAVSPDHQSLLDDDSMDAIVIATPLESHYPIVKAALNAQEKWLSQ
jgi:predicted dehydrogenase